ncbi:MAG: Gfo/Idh/MocA family protein [bacterium]
MSTLRWGVLGVANIAVRAVIPAIQRARRSSLVAIASRDGARTRDAGSRFDIPHAYGSYETLLADPDVGAVYIPLPNSMHRDWTIRCAEAGKHVLCEKPLALTAGACEEMIAAAQRHRVALMEAFMYRFHPRTERVAQLIAEGAIGEPRLVRASFTFAVRDPKNIRLQADLGGGALYDVGCYGINVSRMILGEPREAFARGHTGAGGVDEITGAMLRFDGDRLAIIDCALRLARREEYEVVGTEGRLTVPVAFLPGVADAEIHLVRGTEHSTISVPGVDEYQCMVEHFEDIVLSGAPMRLPPSDAVANIRVIEALLTSMRSGHVERLS